MVEIESLWVVATLIGAAAGVSALMVARHRRPWERGGVALVVGCLFAGLAFAPSLGEPDVVMEAQLPPREEGMGYVGSKSCRSCHPGEYHSWKKTWHRTMTQRAEGEKVRGPFDGRMLKWMDEYYILERRGDRYWVHQMDAEKVNAKPDNKWSKKDAVESMRVVMMTGSHHLQGYWIEGDDGLLEQFPFVYLIREGRWLANEDSFLHPELGPDEEPGRYVWGDGCVLCHTTGPRDMPAPESGKTTDFKEPVITELGISCESCHGPARDHIKVNRNPGRRYKEHLKGEQEEGDSTIINPKRMAHKRSSAICGRCHSVTASQKLADGELDPMLAFRPGDTFEEHFDIKSLAETYDQAQRAHGNRLLTEDEEDALGSFWPDHSVRIAGREYNGMTSSTCYTKGDMGCLSCHSLHEGDPNKQLSPEKPGQQACINCHGEFQGAKLQEHTHHAPSSEGSDCLGCHMPHTSYGLLMATRSHKIDSPSAEGTGSRAKPNACNLCHLDKTMQWTADKLSKWYDQPEREMPELHKKNAAGIVWLMTGNAAQRAIVGWHAGQPGPMKAARTEALIPMLTALQEDPYAAVRQIAARSILNHEGYDHLELFERGNAAERKAQRQKVVDHWRKRKDRSGAEERALLLQNSDNKLRMEDFIYLLSQRDNIKTWISE